MQSESFWTWLASDPGKAAVAGALGGVVRWITLRRNWKEGAGTLIVGCISAVYLGPIALAMASASTGVQVDPGGRTDDLANFLVGIGGISISGFFIQLFERRKKDLEGKSDERD